ncbi:hypothetical protein E2C01_064438 [Portunus trituberculatus]|uniref:Uncharacterized protein n=1 Tax=Portunus trituberculatus TaxID=210409 RepID=A0A5B7HJS3_PORTR|nr:hypothetical protein [Portunus trituberculatus]
MTAAYSQALNHPTHTKKFIPTPHNTETYRHKTGLPRYDISGPNIPCTPHVPPVLLFRPSLPVPSLPLPLPHPKYHRHAAQPPASLSPPPPPPSRLAPLGITVSLFMKVEATEEDSSPVLLEAPWSVIL